MRPTGLFVTATDTDVGKTILAGALVAAIAASGLRVRAHKPIVTGLDETTIVRPADHEILGAAAKMDPREVCVVRYGPAVSPHLAAELAGVGTTREQLVANALGTGESPAGIDDRPRTPDQSRRTDSPGLNRNSPGLNRDGPGGGEVLIVEGVGGLMVPLLRDLTIRDLAVALGLGLVIASRPGLGTINHTLLTVTAAREAGLDVRAVVLTPWPREPSVIERSNRETIARMGDVEVEVLPPVDSPTVDQLAVAGSRLPWRRWLERAPGQAEPSQVKPGRTAV